VKLSTQMEEEAGRFTGETAHRGKDRVGSNQEVGDVSGVDLASDGSMVAGWAVVFENGSAVGGEPDETKDSSVQRGIGGAVVVQGQEVFIEGGDFGKMKSRGGCVANSNDSVGEESGGGDEVVVWCGWVGGRAKGADVYDGPLKFSAAAIFCHFVGRW
jgi:hypothetical protein